MHLTLQEYLAQRQRQFMPKADLPFTPSAIERLRAPVVDVEGAERAAQAALTTIWPGRTFDRTASQQFGTLHQVGFYRASELPLIAVRIGRLPDLFHDWSLWSEAVLQPHLACANLAMPEPLATDCSRSRQPFDFQVSTFVAGKSLSHFDHDDELLAPHLQQLAAYLARLHDIRGEGFGLLSLHTQTQSRQPLTGLSNAWGTYLLLNLEQHIQHCLTAGCIDTAEAEAIRGLLDRDSLCDIPCEPRLLHGDPGSPNCFVQHQEITLIDWEDALLGDPLFELSMWASFHPERRWPTFFDAYFAASSLAIPSDWEARFWLYYLRVALFKTAHRYLFKRTDHPDRPPPSMRIQRALRALGTAVRN